MAEKNSVVYIQIKTDDAGTYIPKNLSKRKVRIALTQHSLKQLFLFKKRI